MHSGRINCRGYQNKVNDHEQSLPNANICPNNSSRVLAHLSRRGGAGTVLSITGQDLGTLSDESITNSLHGAI